LRKRMTMKMKNSKYGRRRRHKKLIIRNPNQMIRRNRKVKVHKEAKKKKKKLFPGLLKNLHNKLWNPIKLRKKKKNLKSSREMNRSKMCLRKTKFYSITFWMKKSSKVNVSGKPLFLIQLEM
jgi:hypothetical protein